MHYSRPAAPRRARLTLILVAALVAAFALPLAAEPKLAAYLPEDVNFYVEAQEPTKLFERLKESPYWKVVEAPELSGMFEALNFAEPDFEGSMVGDIMPFDFGKWWGFVDGSVAAYNTHFGPMNTEGTDSQLDAEVVYHYDGALIFEYDTEKESELRAFFREAIEARDPNSQRDRERIGDVVVETYKLSFETIEKRMVWNENWSPEMSREEAFREESFTVQHEMSYQFALLEDGVAIFGEGSTNPVSKAVEAVEKTRKTLDRSDRFSAAMDAFESRDGSTSGVIAYMSFDGFHEVEEWGKSDEEIAEYHESGFRDFIDLAVQLDHTEEEGTITQLVVGMADDRNGLAEFVDYFRTVSTDDFANVPDSMDEVAAIGFDLGPWMRKSLAQSVADDPQTAAMITMITTQAQMQVGFDPFEAILYRIGGTHVLAEDHQSSSESEGMNYLNMVAAQLGAGGIGQMTISIGVEDSGAIADTLKTLVNKLLEMTGQEIITTQRVGGADVYTMLSEPDSAEVILSFAAANSALVISPQPELIALSIETASGDGKSLARDRDFRRRMRRMPEDSFMLAFLREYQMTGQEVSNVGGMFCSFLWENDLYNPERIEAAYENYSKQPGTEEPLRFGMGGRAWGTWDGSRLMLRSTLESSEE